MTREEFFESVDAMSARLVDIQHETTSPAALNIAAVMLVESPVKEQQPLLSLELHCLAGAMLRAMEQYGYPESPAEARARIGFVERNFKGAL